MEHYQTQSLVAWWNTFAGVPRQVFQNFDEEKKRPITRYLSLVIRHFVMKQAPGVEEKDASNDRGRVQLKAHHSYSRCSRCSRFKAHLLTLPVKEMALKKRNKLLFNNAEYFFGYSSKICFRPLGLIKSQSILKAAARSEFFGNIESLRRSLPETVRSATWHLNFKDK